MTKPPDIIERGRGVPRVPTSNKNPARQTANGAMTPSAAAWVLRESRPAGLTNPPGFSSFERAGVSAIHRRPSPKVKKPEPMVERAINVSDLVSICFDKLHPVTILLGPTMTTEQVVCEPSRIDGVGVRIKKDVSDERWRAVMHIIRNGLGNLKPVDKHILRVYEKKGRWRRI